MKRRGLDLLRKIPIVSIVFKGGSSTVRVREMKSAESYKSIEKGTQARKEASAMNVLMNCGQLGDVKLLPVSSKFVVSNG